jgi:HEAT repeat protein
MGQTHSSTADPQLSLALDKIGGLFTDEWVEPLVSALVSPDASIAGLAAWALSSVCNKGSRARPRPLLALTTAKTLCAAGAQAKIVHAGGVSPLVLMLNSAHDEVRCHAARALGELSFFNVAAAKLIGEDSGSPVQTLLDLLQSQNIRVVQQALKTLAHLCFEAANRRLVHTHNGMQPICALLQSPHDELHASAAGALAWAMHGDGKGHSIVVVVV